MKKEIRINAAHGLCAFFVLGMNITWADWPNENPTKWVQYPEITNGFDVLATAPKMLADDFLCLSSGPITDVHIWGSWWQDRPTNGAVFQISFWSDVPTNQSNPYSHPGALLWSTNFLPTQYVVSNWGQTVNENFYDPNRDLIMGPDTQLFQYNFTIDPADAFFQQQSNVYWLAVTVFGLDTNNFLFGWKSSTEQWNDDAVFGDILPGDPFPLFWEPLHYPGEGPSMDLAFALTTVPEPRSIIGLLLMTLLIWRARRRT